MNTGSASARTIRSRYRNATGMRTGGSGSAFLGPVTSEVLEPTVDNPEPHADAHESAYDRENRGRPDQRSDRQADPRKEQDRADQKTACAGGAPSRALGHCGSR